MSFDEEIGLEHLLFLDRKCRSCKKIKSLLDEFYLTRKDRGTLPSAYSYECKECTKNRVNKNKKQKSVNTVFWEYPDW